MIRAAGAWPLGAFIIGGTSPAATASGAFLPLGQNELASESQSLAEGWITCGAAVSAAGGGVTRVTLGGAALTTLVFPLASSGVTIWSGYFGGGVGATTPAWGLTI